MSLKQKQNKNGYSTKFAVFYSFGQLSDVIGYQMFVFLIFTFYYAVVGLNINLITLGFVIWSIWNAINDPLIGTISDRTNTRWGRRLPFVLIGFIPYCIITVLLWTPPIEAEIATFIYFIVIIILFDTIYTSYSMGQASMFPELFKNLKERAKANNIRQIFTIIALIAAFIMPTFFIPQLDNPKYFVNYRNAGIFAAILIFMFGLVFLKFGVRIPREFSEDYKTAPPFFKSLKMSLSKKSFRWYVVIHFVNWYVYSMLPTIFPLYGSFVLGIGEGQSILIGLLLGLTFISAVFFMFIWRAVAIKYGVRKGIIISQFVFILALIPYMFISNFIQGFIAAIFLGLGLAGSLLYLDILIATVMDEDELVSGVRRAGGFYGISTFILRYASIFMILSISLVFNSVGWAVFDPRGATEETIFGLRLLMFLFPTIALLIGIFAAIKFPITKEKYDEINIQLEKLHSEKREKSTLK
ncbi:MAG: MFS transporter [Candidatus Lokiarchaeota archaeon]|nr:MFS transporter [Candidatus Lokiarchaeota archaeon]MBD3339440.1 MFS transporter [Candidatus Lokiarchaeota archaeon]